MRYAFHAAVRATMRCTGQPGGEALEPGSASGLNLQVVQYVGEPQQGRHELTGIRRDA